MTNTYAANIAAVRLAGYEIVFEEQIPAIRCAYEPLEIFSSVSWDALASHAMNYELCPCGSH